MSSKSFPTQPKVEREKVSSKVLDADQKLSVDGEESVIDGDGENNTRRRRALKKAPDAPKRFKSAYICYVMEKMDLVKANLPQDNKVTETMKVLANMWRTLPAGERQKYEDIAAADKSRYFAEMANYSGPMQVPNKRQKKPPGAPKRAMSAFLSYSQMMRPHIRAEFPDMKNTDISGVLAQRWRDASEEEKRPHLEKELRDREKYHEDMTKWKGEELERMQELQAKQQLQMQIQQQQQQMYSSSSSRPGDYDRKIHSPTLWNTMGMSGMPGYADEGMFAADYGQVPFRGGASPSFSRGGGSPGGGGSNSSRSSTKHSKKQMRLNDYQSTTGQGQGQGQQISAATTAARYDPYSAAAAGYVMGGYLPPGNYPAPSGGTDMHPGYDGSPYDASRMGKQPPMIFPGYSPFQQFPLDTRLSQFDSRRRNPAAGMPYDYGLEYYYSMNQQQNPMMHAATARQYDPNAPPKPKSSSSSAAGRSGKGDAAKAKKATHSGSRAATTGDKKAHGAQISSGTSKATSNKRGNSNTSSPSSPSGGSAMSGVSRGGVSGISNENFCDFGEMKQNDAAGADVWPFSAHSVAKNGDSGNSDSPPSSEESLALFGSKLNDALGSSQGVYGSAFPEGPPTDRSSPSKVRVRKGKKEALREPAEASPLSSSSALSRKADSGGGSGSGSEGVGSGESASGSGGGSGTRSNNSRSRDSIQLIREAFMGQTGSSGSDIGIRAPQFQGGQYGSVPGFSEGSQNKPGLSSSSAGYSQQHMGQQGLFGGGSVGSCEAPFHYEEPQRFHESMRARHDEQYLQESSMLMADSVRRILRQVHEAGIYATDVEDNHRSSEQADSSGGETQEDSSLNEEGEVST
jgi:hypothetical protein